MPGSTILIVSSGMRTMDLTFRSIVDEDCGSAPFGAWTRVFAESWPAYRAWYLKEGAETRPSYRDCRQALLTHMPEMVPLWENLTEAAGGSDLAARFLSLYCPPAYLTGCSQAIWPGEEPLLVRNYDYSERAFDALMLKTRWNGRAVMGTSDCLIGLVDGVNDAGLAVSLTFGGRRIVGPGFGVPIILRYLLQTCETTEEAVRRLKPIPSHMAYNVTILDARRHYATAYLSPDRATIVSRSPVATNHQGHVEWIEHARETASVERERFLLNRLMLHEESADRFIAAFLRPPLYSLAFRRGFGTLYTAALWPGRGEMDYRWPEGQWHHDLARLDEDERFVRYSLAG
jgi:predicted choloylglycine hydrolase